MRLDSPAPRVHRLLFCCLVGTLLAAACSSSRTPSASPGGSAGAGTGEAGAGDGDSEPVPVSLAFTPSSLLKLRPKQTRELTVTTDPPGSFPVRFALIGWGADGAPSDAVLDTGGVQSDPNGTASVLLTAPSTPTSFSVRASVGDVQTSLDVSVSSLGYTTLSVLPQYGGHRTVTQWTTSVRSGTKCSKLSGNPPPDASLAVSAPAGEPLTLLKVPVGVALTITLRAGHYIGGCADQAALAEVDGNQLAVYASDRPLNLDATRLDLSFGPSNASPEFSKLVAAGAGLAGAALTASSGSDVQALLDSMLEATVAANRDAFSATRLSQSWDAALTTAFGGNAATRLRGPAARWMNAGLQSFAAPDTFKGQLTSLGDGALLSLVSVAGVPAADAGFPTSFQSSWSADSSDTLLIGTQLSWVPSRLVTALASAPALLEQPQASSVESALAMNVDCALVAHTLLAHGAIAGSAVYVGCDESCALNACNSAVSALWQKARDSSGATVATLGVTATGSAAVGDDASVTSLKGTWLGALSVGVETELGAGTLSALASGD